MDNKIGRFWWQTNSADFCMTDDRFLLADFIGRRNWPTLSFVWHQLNTVIMGDRLQPGKPSWYVTSHPGRLSLAIPPWVGATSTSESWDVNRHTARCTSQANTVSVSVVCQCKLVSGWGLRKRRSAPPYGPYGSGRTLRYVTSLSPAQSLSSPSVLVSLSKYRCSSKDCKI